MPGVWIRGVGIVCSAGSSAESIWRVMSAGQTAIARPTRFRVPGGRSGWIGSTPIEAELELGEVPDAASARLCLAMARHAIADALSGGVVSAGGSEGTKEGKETKGEAETALVWASNLEDHDVRMHELAGQLADAFDLGGPRFGVSVACASATLALTVAARLITAGDARRVLVVASDVITPRVFAGFDLLGLLADGPCVPFSPRLGTSLGEGAAAMLLDADAGSQGQGTARAGPMRIAGWGTSNDAHHPTQPHPGGEGVARSLQAAVARAGCAGAAIEHMVAHGTGTAANDAAEWQGLARALGRHSVPVSSLKALTGHTQGACGLVELAATLIAIRHDAHPPTVGFDRARAGAPPDVVGPRPRPGAPRTFACNNSGFGGSNASLVVTSDPPTRGARAAARPIFILGVGEIDEPRAASLDPRRAVRGVDLRPLEPWAQALTVALSEALLEAGHRPSRRDPTGLSVGQARVSLAQARRLALEYADAGIYRASANVFTQTFLGYPASAAAACLGLRGPFGVSTEGRCAGLVALTHAGGILAEEGARSMLVGEVDGGPDAASAVGLALGIDFATRSGTRSVEFVAHAFASERAPERAHELALERANWAADSLDAIVEPRPGELGLAALARAHAALRRGELTRVLVRGRQAGALACAILLEAHAC